MSTPPPVICATLLDQISGYLDEELPASTCEAIEAHAQACQACARVIDGFRTTTGLCRQVAHTPLPDSVRALAQARVAALLRASRKD